MSGTNFQLLIVHDKKGSGYFLVYASPIPVKSGITTKFTANYDAIEDSLKTSTVGLVTLDEMREKQRDVVEARFCHQFLLLNCSDTFTHRYETFFKL